MARTTVQAILAVLIVSATVLAISLDRHEAVTPLMTLSGYVIGFYFGHEIGKSRNEP